MRCCSLFDTGPALVREHQRIDPAALRAAPKEGLCEQTADLSGL
jgi:hypothetical protein